MLDNNTIKAVVAMGCITIIEAALIFSGTNGVAATIVIGALAGLGGFTLGVKRTQSGSG